MGRVALRRSFWFLGGIVATLVLTYWMACHTPWGRQQLQERASHWLSDTMGGDVQIRELEEVRLSYIRARGVSITAPDGKPCVEVERLEAWLDVAALRHGTFAWKRAHASGGRVFVREDEQGNINMEEAFKRARPKPRRRGHADLLDLRNLQTKNVRVVIDGHDLPGLRIKVVRGTMRVRVPYDEEVTLRFDDYSGELVKGLPSGALRFHGLKGRVSTRGDRLLRFQGQGDLEGQGVEFTIDVHKETSPATRIDAHFDGISGKSLSTRAVAAWSKAMPELDLRMHREPLSESHDAPSRAR